MRRLWASQRVFDLLTEGGVRGSNGGASSVPVGAGELVQNGRGPSR
jgi:hypothetical protein